MASFEGADEAGEATAPGSAEEGNCFGGGGEGNRLGHLCGHSGGIGKEKVLGDMGLIRMSMAVICVKMS